MTTSFFAGVLSGAVLSSTSMLYATVGEVIGERSGIVNLGLEGVMLVGAVGGFVVTAESGNPYLGVLAAALAGAVFNMIFAYLVVTRRGNQLASGLTLMFFALGLTAIIGKSYVGKPVIFRNWDEAASELRNRHQAIQPGYTDEQWNQYTRRVLRETDRGVEFDYDMRIAEPFDAANSGEAPDIWPYYRALAGRPILVLRGEHSDLLTDDALARMGTEIPDVETVTVPGVGHAPNLDEPEAIAAIDRLLERVLKR